MSVEQLLSLRNLPYQPHTPQDVAARLVEHAANRRNTRLVVPVNCQVFVLAQHEPALAEVILRAEDVVLDGISVAAATWLLGRPRVHRSRGVDLMMEVCTVADAHKLRVLLIGGRPGAADKTKELIEIAHPGLRVKAHCPPMGFEKSEEELALIRKLVGEFQPDIVFVALGAPKQEVFMQTHLRPLKIPVVMAVGGSFEMLSGMILRAPVWVQKIGMEWLFRMVMEPKRLTKRYVTTNTRFLWVLAQEMLARKAVSSHQDS